MLIYLFRTSTFLIENNLHTRDWSMPPQFRNYNDIDIKCLSFYQRINSLINICLSICRFSFFLFQFSCPKQLNHNFISYYLKLCVITLNSSFKFVSLKFSTDRTQLCTPKADPGFFESPRGLIRSAVFVWFALRLLGVSSLFA